MMLNAVRCDFRRWINTGMYLWIFPIAITIVIAISNIKLTQIYSTATKVDWKLTFADLSLLLFQGGRPYDLASGEPFQAPATWLLEQLFMCILVCRMDIYPRNTLDQSIILNIHKRRFWWEGKCIATVCQVATTYLLQFAVLFILAPQKETPFQLSPDLLQQAFSLPINGDSGVQWPIYAMFFPCLVSLLLCIIQLYFSLMIGVIAGGIVTFLYLSAAAFYDSPLLVGKFMMVVRSPICSEPEPFGNLSMLILLLIAIACFVLGILHFKKKDLY